MNNNQTDFLKGIDRFIAELEGATQQTVKHLSELAVAEAQNTTAFNNKLKDATQFKMSGSFASEVFDSREYAFYLEEGNNQAGDRIYPVNAKALHFFINGQEIFAKSVRAHAGYHFVESGRNIAANHIESIFSHYLGEII